MKRNLILIATIVVLGGVLAFLYLQDNGTNSASQGSAAQTGGEEQASEGDAVSGGASESPTTATESVGDTPQETPNEVSGAPATTTEDNTVSDETDKNPVAVIETNVGTIRIELYADLAPITAGNFVKLVKQKFYDGLIFHRVIKGFMIQGGDPNCVSGQGACGAGGPGWSIPLEIVDTLKHSEAGIVAMARSNDPDSAGSQFYITLAAQSFLDGKYAVFGKVVEGLDIVMAIGSVATNDSDRPLEDVIMERVYLE